MLDAGTRREVRRDLRSAALGTRLVTLDGLAGRRVQRC